MSRIHPSAIISKKAELDEDVDIGPYCVIGDGVELASACVLMSHVVIEGPCRIASNNRFHPFLDLKLISLIAIQFQSLKNQMSP